MSLHNLPSVKHLLVLPHLRVQNANAISSPLTHGFPAITAFMGWMWALERKARARGLPVRFSAVGVVCHNHQELVTDEGFVRTFRLTRNPVGKDGSTAAIVEEGRIHLEISLVLAVHGDLWDEDPAAAGQMIPALMELVHSLRLAGGSVLPVPGSNVRRSQPFAVHLTGTEQQMAEAFSTLRRAVLPGFALVSRDDLIQTRLQALLAEQPDATRLDAWLSLARINWRYHPPEQDSKAARDKAWWHDRAGLGWVVPIPVGYGALGPLHDPGAVANARDATTPFRFVESLYSVGQWISPHRLQDPVQMLWFADTRQDTGLYRCRNFFSPAAEAADEDYDFN
ncbi:type I-F CRISPR-associated protein Csy2 [Amphibiibacter pelophylacis]|uniref:Type I-F CRISPR-associated protein Csy2 n=1 Tax=Amphibiibacter pelophylacis TaxID=1799477 RepID=A0ACC6P3C8_9BURK